jgi:predicted nucleic acid-binding protein
MNVVVDANILIAALLGSKTAITLITAQEYSFYAPRCIVDEVRKYRDYICQKAEQTVEEFDVNFDALMVFVQVLEYSEYYKHMEKSREAIAERDWKDADYIACALAIPADFIWTNDKDFTAQTLVPIKTTQQMMHA